MSWFLRGVQSAVFHYASCAPCTGYAEGRKRRRAANKARLLREKLQSENPDEYHHPEPTGTNPFWDEEIRMGPGPPPRRARRANPGCSRAVTTPVTHGSVLSKGGSSLDGDHPEEMRLSDDTLDDDNWNRKRYQREDEDLWGHDGAVIPVRIATSASSGGGSAFSLKRPGTSRSGSYYSVRAPPSSEVHAPVVSLPSPDPLENRWMLQPPPKASVMAGKERAKNRSRSGSGASSRVELSLQRQLSTRHVLHKLDRGETPELPSISPNSSYSNLVSGQRHDRSRTPQIRPPSASSSRHIKRRDTAMTRTDTMSTHNSSVESSEAMLRTDSAGADDSHISSLRVRQTRPALSTVVSSGSVEQDPSHSPLHSRHLPNSSDEDIFLTKPPPTHQPGVTRPHIPKPRTPLSSSDISSLNRLQELVSPHDLLKSRFVSAPLVEAKIRLPPEDEAEEAELRTEREKKWRWSVDF